MCDNKNSVMFTKTECLVLSPNFMLLDESQVLLRVLKQSNIYSFDLQNVVPSVDLTCLFAKASIDESNLWHRRLGHVNFKTMNKLMKGNLNSTVNKVAERKNKTLIKLARTMLADLLLPITFWAEAVNTACYVLNRALVTKTHNKTPYELLNGRTPRQDFMRPFGYLVTILNTLDPLGKFRGKADEGFLVGYSVTSKAFRVFNTKTKKVKENQHVKFLENKPNVTGPGPNWLFDIDSLTNSMNYIPVFAGNQTDKNVGSQDTNGNAGTQDNVDTGKEVFNQHYIVLLLWSSITSTFKSLDDKATDDKPTNDTGSNTDTSELQSTGIFNSAYDDDLDIFESPIQSVGAKANFNNMEPSTIVSHIPIHRVHLDHPKDQILGDPKSVVQTRGMAKKSSRAHALMEPKKVSQALDDASCVEAMQEELLQFSLQKVWRLVDLPYGKKAIETKWVYRNKKDERGIVVRNKARLVAQGTRQEEGIDYDEKVWRLVDLPYRKKAIETKWVYRNKKDERGIVVRNKARLVAQGPIQEEGIYYVEVFAPVGQIEAIRILLAFASYMGFIVYQMDIKSAFLYGIIEEEVYVDDIIFRSTKKSLCDEFKALMHKSFLILKKFDFSSVKIASTPLEAQKPLVKDEEATDVDVHIYKSMIRSLMYSMASRPDIMFAVCACSRFHVTPKLTHLHAVKRIFRKSKTGCCQFLGRRLISWQCKKQPIVATSTTEAKYVAAANCCGQNLVYHLKIKHIEIRHHFIRDSYEKKLIKVLKIQTNDNVADLLTKAFDVMSNDPIALEIGSDDTLRCQETTLGDTDAQTREESMEHQDDLTDLYHPHPMIYLSQVLALEEAKTNQDKVITKLKLRVEKIEKKRKARTSQPMKRRLFKGRVKTSNDKSLGGSIADQVSTTRPEVSTVTPSTPLTTTTIFGDKDLTIAQTLIKLRKLPQRIYEEELLELDRAQKERQKQEQTTIADLIEEFDEIQARMDADHELAIRMTHEEQEKYTVEERARLLAEYFERRKK
nr:hypothetical protein [Tanacetum cinerariifolium]